jgi:hypothetical protein
MPATASRLVLILHPHPQQISEFSSMAFPFTLDARAPLLQFSSKARTMNRLYCRPRIPITEYISTSDHGRAMRRQR